eukprot:g3986.t1
MTSLMSNSDNSLPTDHARTENLSSSESDGANNNGTRNADSNTSSSSIQRNSSKTDNSHRELFESRITKEDCSDLSLGSFGEAAAMSNAQVATFLANKKTQYEQEGKHLSNLFVKSYEYAMEFSGISNARSLLGDGEGGGAPGEAVSGAQGTFGLNFDHGQNNMLTNPFGKGVAKHIHNTYVNLCLKRFSYIDDEGEVAYRRLHPFEVAMLMNLNPQSLQEAIVLIPSLGKECVVPYSDDEGGPKTRKGFADDDIESILVELKKHSLQLLSGGL